MDYRPTAYQTRFFESAGRWVWRGGRRHDPCTWTNAGVDDMVEAVAEDTAVKIRLLALLPDGAGKIEQLFDNTQDGKQASIAEAMRQLELGRMVYVGREEEVLAVMRRLAATERRLLELVQVPKEDFDG